MAALLGSGYGGAELSGYGAARHMCSSSSSFSLISFFFFFFFFFFSYSIFSPFYLGLIFCEVRLNFFAQMFCLILFCQIVCNLCALF
jgi:hypothetical protein